LQAGVLTTFKTEGSAGLTRGLWPRHCNSSKNENSLKDILHVHFEIKNVGYLSGL